MPLESFLSLLDKYSDNALLVSIVLLYGVNRWVVKAICGQLTEWHREQHEGCKDGCFQSPSKN